MLKKLLCFIMGVVVAFCSIGTTSVLAATRAPAKEPTKITASWDVVGKTVKVSFEKDKKANKTSVKFGYYKDGAFYIIANKSTNKKNIKLKIPKKIKYDTTLKYAVLLQSRNKYGLSDEVSNKVTLTGKKYLFVYISNKSPLIRYNFKNWDGVYAFKYTGKNVKPYAYMRSSYSENINESSKDAVPINTKYVKIKYPKEMKEAGVHYAKVSLTAQGKKRFVLVNCFGDKSSKKTFATFGISPGLPKITYQYDKAKKTLKVNVEEGIGARNTYALVMYTLPFSGGGILHGVAYDGSISCFAELHSYDNINEIIGVMSPSELKHELSEKYSIDFSKDYKNYIPTIRIVAWSDADGFNSDVAITEIKL